MRMVYTRSADVTRLPPHRCALIEQTIQFRSGRSSMIAVCSQGKRAAGRERRNTSCAGFTFSPDQTKLNRTRLFLGRKKSACHELRVLRTNNKTLLRKFLTSVSQFQQNCRSRTGAAFRVAPRERLTARRKLRNAVARMTQLYSVTRRHGRSMPETRLTS